MANQHGCSIDVRMIGQRMALRRTVILAIVAGVGPGCEIGAQRGKYAISGDGSTTLDGECGDFIVVRGHALPLTSNPGSGKPLLYVLAAAPGFKATGSGLKGSHKTHVSTIEWHWSNEKEQITGALTWDRRTDEVNVGGATFDRTKGRAFVVVRDGNEWKASQVALNESPSRTSEAFKRIQELLPADSPVKKVKLNEAADEGQGK